MAVNNVSRFSTQLNKWFFWKANRRAHCERIRLNAYEIIANQNFLVKNPSRAQLELEMKFFKKLSSKIGDRSEVYNIDLGLDALQQVVSEHDQKVSKFVDQMVNVSKEDYILMSFQPKAYGQPDRSELDQYLIQAQTNTLDLLLKPESLTNLESYKKERDQVFEGLKKCRRLSEKITASQQRLSLAAIDEIRSRYRFPEISKRIGASADLISNMTNHLSTLVIGGGIVAGLAVGVATNSISFKQAGATAMLFGMVAWGYFSKQQPEP